MESEMGFWRERLQFHFNWQAWGWREWARLPDGIALRFAGNTAIAHHAAAQRASKKLEAASCES
jgi:hypothetical protein